MKKLLAVAFCGLIAATAAQGKGASPKGMIMRGGLGFIFVDNNNFRNVSQFASSHATALEAKYAQQNNSPTAGASLVWGNGTFGLGAYGQRAGTNLTGAGNYADSAGAGLALAVIPDRLNVGANFSKVITTSSATNNGVAGAQFTLMGPHGCGFALGGGGTMVLGDTSGNNVQTGTVSLGYGFKPNVGVEALITINDIKDTTNWAAGGYFNWGGDIVYLGAGYEYVKQSANGQVVGRFGFELGKYFDISAFGTYGLAPGSQPFFGVSARVSL